MHSKYMVLKLALSKRAWSCYKMPDERLPANIFYGELQEGGDFWVARRNATKTP